MAETLQRGFQCRDAFGLGITSCADFVRAISAYKTAREAGIAYINSNTTAYDARAGLVVFDGLRQLIRFARSVTPTQVVVVSEVATLLREVTGVRPLDYQNNRSFEFNFVAPDFTGLIASLRRRNTSPVVVGFIDRDSLGFHIDVAAKPDAFVAAFMSLMANLPFQHRHRMRRALTAYFVESKPDAAPVLAVVRTMADMALPEEVDTFVTLFEAEHTNYHAAVNSDKPAEWTAKKYGVNPYATAFLRKMVRSVTVTTTKVQNHDKAAPENS